MWCGGTASQQNNRDVKPLYFKLKFYEFYWVAGERVSVIAGAWIWWCPAGSFGGWLGRDQAAPLAGQWWHVFGKRHVPRLGRLQLFKVAGCFCGWMERSGTWAVGIAGWEGTMFLQGVCFSIFLILWEHLTWKLHLPAKEGAYPMLWVGCGCSLWAPAAEEGKSEP